MSVFLAIPWFRAQALEIPVPGTEHVIPIQPFGVLVAIGVILGTTLAERWGKRHGIAPRVVADFALHMLIAAFVGAFVLNGIFYHPEVLPQVFEDPIRHGPWSWGMSSFGGFVGAICGLLIWRHRRKLPALRVADAAAWAFPAAWFFGRMGCFVVHDHPGQVTDFFLGIEAYEFGHRPYETRHDLGLYEVLWSAAVFGLYVWLDRKRRAPGFYVVLLPVLYTPIRFYLDFLRAIPDEGGDARYAGLTPAQYAAIALLLISLWLLRRVVTRQVSGTLPPWAQWPPNHGDPGDPTAGEAPGGATAGSATAGGETAGGETRDAAAKDAVGAGSAEGDNAPKTAKV